MFKKIRIVCSVPFLLLASLFKMIFIAILPKDLREEAKKMV